MFFEPEDAKQIAELIGSNGLPVIIEEVKRMRGQQKVTVLSNVSNYITREIESIESIHHLPRFSFGKISGNIREPWIKLSPCKDKTIESHSTRLDRKLKIHTRSLIIKELSSLKIQDPNHDTSELENQEYGELVEKLLLHYKSQIKHAKTFEEVWVVVDCLLAISQATMITFNSPTFENKYRYIHDECGGVKYLQIFDSRLSRTLFKTLEEFHAKEISSCETKEKAIELFFKYPIIKGKIGAMSDRFDHIQSHWND